MPTKILPFQYVTALICLSLLAFSCKKEKSLDTDADPAQARTLLNQAYGNGARQRADVYLPANRSSTTRVMVVLHGGSWIEGDKADINPYIPILQTSLPNTAIVNINYTLANGVAENRHPRQMEDITTVLSWIDAQATTWQVGNTRIMLGVSAGAHLAMLYAYAYSPSGRIKAVASLVGPTNFTDAFYINNPLFQNVALSYLGSTYATNPTLHQQASPALRVSATAPPTFMAYGAQDVLVPVSNATTLVNQLTTFGIPHRYELYHNEGHEFSTAAATDALGKWRQFVEVHAP